MRTKRQMEHRNHKEVRNVKNRKPFEIKNMTDNSADMYIYSDIVSDEIEGYWYGSDAYPIAVKNFLDSVKGKDLNVYINSNGGSVFAGITIFNMIQRHVQNGNKVDITVDGLAASISSVIAFSGTSLTMPSNSYLMIHRAWSGMQGNAEDMREMADTLDKIDATILGVYENNLKDGVDLDTVKELMDAETWMDGNTASQYFNIKIAEPVKAVACISDITYKNMPNNLITKSTEDIPSEEEPKMENKAQMESQVLENEKINNQKEEELELLRLHLELL